METQADFKELLELLNAQNVEYMVVGAHALAYHGVPRATGDLDIWVRPTAENARRIIQVLENFGFGSLGLQTDDFVAVDKVIQLGVVPVRVDLVTSITGVAWEQAVENRASGMYGDVPVSFLGREQFIANKRASARAQDLADIEALGES